MSASVQRPPTGGCLFDSPLEAAYNERNRESLHSYLNGAGNADPAYSMTRIRCG